MTTYIFAIGGTGARVLRALTMLLAAGVEDTSMNNEIVPVLIDYDGDNGDTKRVQDIMEHYQAVNALCYKDSIHGPHNQHYFCTPITKLHKKMRGANNDQRFMMQLPDIDDGTSYSGFIKHGAMTQRNGTAATRHLLDSLYSTVDGINLNTNEDNPDAELHMRVHHGFRGSPSIGRVMMMKLKDSADLQNLNLAAGDRIFIIGSIFGGTGASGIPMLLDYFKEDADGKFGTNKIGVLFVTPYFEIANDDHSPISSATFIAKTKAAVEAYKDTVYQKADAVYVVGDSRSASKFDNREGGNEQRNEAHVVEMAGAIMTMDFINRGDDELIPLNGTFEFALNGDGDVPPVLNYDDFTDDTKKRWLDPMASFVVFKTFCQNYFIPQRCERRDIWLNRTGLSEHEDLRTALKAFFKDFDEWIEEMEGEKHPFKLFDIKQRDYCKLLAYKELKKGGRWGSVCFTEKDIRDLLGRANGDNEFVYEGRPAELFMVNAYTAIANPGNRESIAYKIKNFN